jgi:circadian clock protein KaiC
MAPSGIGELDTLVGGGLDYGTTTLVIGPSGSGKSTWPFQISEAAMRATKRLW